MTPPGRESADLSPPTAPWTLKGSVAGAHSKNAKVKGKGKVKKRKEKRRDISFKMKENPSTHLEALDSQRIPPAADPWGGGALLSLFLSDS